MFCFIIKQTYKHDTEWKVGHFFHVCLTLCFSLRERSCFIRFPVEPSPAFLHLAAEVQRLKKYKLKSVQNVRCCVPVSIPFKNKSPLPQHFMDNSCRNLLTRLQSAFFRIENTSSDLVHHGFLLITIVRSKIWAPWKPLHMSSASSLRWETLCQSNVALLRRSIIVLKSPAICLRTFHRLLSRQKKEGRTGQQQHHDALASLTLGMIEALKQCLAVCIGITSSDRQQSQPAYWYCFRLLQ